MPLSPAHRDIIVKSLAVAVPILIVALAVASQHIFQVVYLFGYHRHVHNHEPGQCRLIPGFEQGSEDITVLPNGVAFISTGFKAPGHDNSKIQSALWMFDFNNPDANATELVFDSGFDKTSFGSHGISVWVDTTGDIYIYAVNHHPDGDRIEVFIADLSNNILLHQKTIIDRLIYSVNDLVVVDKDRFYITNDLYSANKRKFYEIMLLFKWGNVVYYDGQSSEVVASGLHYPNGINLSKNKKFLYVATFLGQHIHVYRRLDDKSLIEIRQIPLYSHVDNIELDPDDPSSMWLGSHPILWRCLQHHGPNLPASHVLHVQYDPETNSEPKLTELLMNDGQKIAGSTVASYYRGSMLVGTVWHRMMYCDIETPFPI